MSSCRTVRSQRVYFCLGHREYGCVSWSDAPCRRWACAGQKRGSVRNRKEISSDLGKASGSRIPWPWRLSIEHRLETVDACRSLCQAGRSLESNV